MAQSSCFAIPYVDMKNKKYLIVINPQTRKKGQRYLNSLTSALNKKDLSYDIYHTVADLKSTQQTISEKLSNYSDVVSIGGDGTLNMLSNILAYKNIPLGIIPCGTGNDFSRHIYKKTDDIISTVTNDKVMEADLGWCNERYFMNVLGVGYDAMIAEKTKDDNKILFRSFFYLWNAVKYLPFYKEKIVHIKADYFNKNEATFMVAFGNGSFFGSGMNITPKADISDGLLDCCWVGKLSFIRKCNCLLKIFSGEHLLAKNIEYVHGKQFQVLPERHPIEADGEFIGYTPATIRIEEKALLLKVP
jgi:YegS/Rv2252/BmrU family lipid kinase